MMEIERKFIPDPDSSELRATLRGADQLAIEQGYLLAGEDGEVRIRRVGDTCLITVKKGGGLEREEYEGEISRELFATLWPATAGARVRKTRYTATLCDQEGRPAVVEIDEFLDVPAGLILVEVEFESTAAARAFASPPWFGREVTGDPRYTNRALARRAGGQAHGPAR